MTQAIVSWAEIEFAQAAAGGAAGALTAAGTATAAFVGATAVTVNAGALTAAGTATASFVGATAVTVAAGALTAAGAATVAAAGTGVRPGALTAAGSATLDLRGAAIGAGAFTAAGAATVAVAGTGIRTGALAVAGSATIDLRGASTAAGALTAAGSAAVSAVGSGLTFIFLRPDADVIDGGWTNEAGSNVNLFASIDEATASDADYIQSAPSPASDVCKISLGDAAFALVAPVYVRYRYKKDSAAQTMALTVRLLEGTTQRASWTQSNISTAFVTTEQTLSAGELASIADFNNLFLEFTATAS